MTGKMPEKETDPMQLANINPTDARRFVDRNGQTNIIGRVRATRKGQKAYNGPADGVDGSRWHVIRMGADGVIYCTDADNPKTMCPAMRFAKSVAGVKKPCKHVLAFLDYCRSVIDSDAPAISTDIIVYRIPACAKAA